LGRARGNLAIEIAPRARVRPGKNAPRGQQPVLDRSPQLLPGGPGRHEDEGRGGGAKIQLGDGGREHILQAAK
jgi:hypothetical protein